MEEAAARPAVPAASDAAPSFHHALPACSAAGAACGQRSPIRGDEGGGQGSRGACLPPKPAPAPRPSGWRAIGGTIGSVSRCTRADAIARATRAHLGEEAPQHSCCTRPLAAGARVLRRRRHPVDPQTAIGLGLASCELCHCMKASVAALNSPERSGAAFLPSSDRRQSHSQPGGTQEAGWAFPMALAGPLRQQGPLLATW